MPSMSSLAEFNEEARKRSTAQQFFLDTSQETDRVIYFSCLPWVDLTALTNERDFSSPDSKNDSIPRIAWGKYIQNGDRLELGISIEVNHRLIDGFHIGQFVQRLEKLIREL